MGDERMPAVRVREAGYRSYRTPRRGQSVVSLPPRAYVRRRWMERISPTDGGRARRVQLRGRHCGIENPSRGRLGRIYGIRGQQQIDAEGIGGTFGKRGVREKVREHDYSGQ